MNFAAGTLGGTAVPAARQANDPNYGFSNFGKVLFTNPMLGHALGSLLQGRPFWGTMIGLSALNQDLVQQAFGFRMPSFGSAPKPPEPPKPPAPPEPPKPPAPPMPKAGADRLMPPPPAPPPELMAQPATRLMPPPPAPPPELMAQPATRLMPPPPAPPPELMAQPATGRYYPPAPAPPPELSAAVPKPPAPRPSGLGARAGMSASRIADLKIVPPQKAVLHRETPTPAGQTLPSYVNLPQAPAPRPSGLGAGGGGSDLRITDVKAVPLSPTPVDTLRAAHQGWGYITRKLLQGGNLLGPDATPDEFALWGGWDLADDAAYYAEARRLANASPLTRMMMHPANPGAAPLEILRRTGSGLRTGAGRAADWASNTRLAQWTRKHVGRPLADVAGTATQRAKDTARWVASHTPKPVARATGAVSNVVGATGKGLAPLGPGALRLAARSAPYAVLGYEALQGARYLSNPKFRREYTTATTPQSYGGGVGGYIQAGLASMEGLIPGVLETGAALTDLVKQYMRNRRAAREWEQSAPQREAMMRRLGIYPAHPGAK